MKPRETSPRTRGHGHLDGISRLLAATRGATLVEFGFVAVPLIALLLAILETALITFAQQVIETSTETAARVIMTGQAQSANNGAGMSQSQFHDQICTTLPSLLKCNKLMVDVQRASSFATVDMSPPALTYDSSGNVTNSFSYAVGGSGDIVIVRLIYLWPVATMGFGLGLANAGHNHLLIGTNVAKTEPYT